MKPIITIVDSLNNRYVDQNLDLERSVLQEQAHLFLKQVIDYHALLEDEAVMQADVIISWYAIPFPEILIERLQNCRAIVRPAVGFENIDIEAARRKGIDVLNIPDYGTEEVSDHTLALILACMRRLLDTNIEASQNGTWDWKAIGMKTKRLSGLNAGIVGLGRIGKGVALRLKALGVSVCFYDPYEKSGIHKALGIQETDSLETLFQESDILSFHVPLTEETKHMLNSRNCSKINKDAIIVNTCRGSVIEEAALISLLQYPEIRLGLDVLENEPHIPDAFKNNARVILTGHSAFYSSASLHELKSKAVLTAIMVLQGKKLKNIVN